MKGFFPLVLLTLDKTFLDEKRVAYPFIVMNNKVCLNYMYCFVAINSTCMALLLLTQHILPCCY
jgi:hypothetical protein